jgi:hypothetical protein
MFIHYNIVETTLVGNALLFNMREYVLYLSYTGERTSVLLPKLWEH